MPIENDSATHCFPHPRPDPIHLPYPLHRSLHLEFLGDALVLRHLLDQPIAHLIRLLVYLLKVGVQAAIHSHHADHVRFAFFQVLVVPLSPDPYIILHIKNPPLRFHCTAEENFCKICDLGAEPSDAVFQLQPVLLIMLAVQIVDDVLLRDVIGRADVKSAYCPRRTQPMQG